MFLITNFELIKLFKKFDGRGRGSFSNNLRNNIKLEFFVIENVFGHEFRINKIILNKFDGKEEDHSQII